MKTCNTGIPIFDEFKRENRGKAKTFNTLTFDWPSAIFVIGRLEEIVGRGFFDDQKSKNPILFQVISDGLNSYESGRLTYKKKFGTYSTSDFRIASFLDGLITSTCKNMDVKLLAANDMVWSMDKPKSIFEFLENIDTNQNFEKLQKSLSETTRELLYITIATDDVRLAIKRGNYEGNIMVRSLGVHH